MIRKFEEKNTQIGPSMGSYLVYIPHYESMIYQKEKEKKKEKEKEDCGSARRDIFLLMVDLNELF